VSAQLQLNKYYYYYKINWVSRFGMHKRGCGCSSRAGADERDEEWLSEFAFFLRSYAHFHTAPAPKKN
jgi:hypothetical protein